MNKILKLLKDPYYVVGHYLMNHYPHLMSDRFFIKVLWKESMGYKIDLNNPRTFNEKLQWLKLNARNPLYSTLVDKYTAKQWVADKIGQQYVIPNLAVYDSVDQIDLDKLPDRFVLKCNHDCGSIVICKDKSSFDLEAAKKKLDAAMKRNYYWDSREWPYKNVKPRIIAEPYLEDSSGELRDYKVYAFNGECDYLMLCFDRSKGETKFIYFDRNWVIQKELSNHGLKYGDTIEVERPYNLDLIFEFAEKLSSGFPFVRVDFYETNRQLLFGEMTFYPSAGFDGRRTKALEDYLNKRLILPRK